MSSFGRLALGIVGAVIGAPFGLSAIGFSIGSALGGFIFANEVDGPDIEGPRIGDTDVTTSTLGKTISEHYGVTRAAGNVFWSAGLKETKTVTETGGGGKGGGGGGGTQTTYEYFGNFAISFGKGPAAFLFRVWADGKLIYDIGSGKDVQVDKYKFRFRQGLPDQPIDPLIEESINRRLNGLADVNEGSGPQSSYRTIDDLITEAQLSADATGDSRAALYVTYLQQLKDNATPGTPNDYKLTPAYRDIAYIIFEDMPLADFGNRIPNITAEIAWGTFGDEVFDELNKPLQVNVAQISEDRTQPVTGVGVDPQRLIMIVRSGTQLRKFEADQSAETLVDTFTVDIPGYNPPATIIDQILGAEGNGNIVARATYDSQFEGDNLVRINSNTLTVSGSTSKANRDANPTHVVTGNGAEQMTFGSFLGNNQGTSTFAGMRPDGYYYIVQTGTAASAGQFGGSAIRRVYGGPAGQEGVGDQRTPFAAGIQFIGDGPITSAFISPQSVDPFNPPPSFFNPFASDQYALVNNDTDWELLAIQASFGLYGENNDRGRSFVSFSVMDTAPLNGDTVSSVLYDGTSDRVFALWQTASGGGRIKKYQSDGTVLFNRTLTYPPPNPVSGLQNSSISNGRLVYAYERNVIQIDLSNGDEIIFEDALSGDVTQNVQVYLAQCDTLYTWIDEQPIQVLMGRNNSRLAFQQANTVQSVISTICARTGMGTDEYDVSGVDPAAFIRGYTISRPSTGRASLEKILSSYFVEGVESDFTVKFQDRGITAIRTITEDELGTIRGDTGDVNFLEARQPEYDIPVEMNVAYIDEDRDYQQGAAQYQRISQPTPSMYSEKTQNLELPIVFKEGEASGIAQRLLFLSWLSRDSGRTRLNWSHLDLDPGDVIAIEFDDGRTLTDRITKHTTGANFEIDLETARTGDPVYTASILTPIGSGNVPSTDIVGPQFSELFVLDIPLLEDFHDLNRNSFRYYTAIGADNTSWLSATLYQSLDANQYASFDTAIVDATWGVCTNTLGAPRNVWATDKENTLNVRLSVDNGDVSTVTFEQIVNENANRALIYNQTTGISELIQFQDVTVNDDDTITLSNLSRGRRGTDFAAYDHEDGEYFILITDSSYQSHVNPLDVLGSTLYYKAVSSGGLIASAPNIPITWIGRDLRPYAPNRVNREEVSGDIKVTWTRRTRFGGEWNMISTGRENVPLNEDFEEYEFYLIEKDADTTFDPDDASTYSIMRETNDPEYTITAAELSTAGYVLNDTLSVVIYQVSTQVGRGFPAEGTLAA